MTVVASNTYSSYFIADCYQISLSANSAFPEKTEVCEVQAQFGSLKASPTGKVLIYNDGPGFASIRECPDGTLPVRHASTFVPARA